MRESGFELVGTELEARGSVTARDASGARVLAISIADRMQDLVIVPGVGAETRARFDELAKLAGTSTHVRVRGAARTEPSTDLAITIAEFEVIDAR